MITLVLILVLINLSLILVYPIGHFIAWKETTKPEREDYPFNWRVFFGPEVYFEWTDTR